MRVSWHTTNALSNITGKSGRCTSRARNLTSIHGNVLRNHHPTVEEVDQEQLILEQQTRTSNRGGGDDKGTTVARETPLRYGRRPRRGR